MDIQKYFAQTDTPSAHSPVGTLMLKISQKHQMDCEEGRTEANRLLEIASGKRVFRVPTVYSPEETAERRARMLAAFERSKTVQAAA
jgi:hypothetical protein